VIKELTFCEARGTSAVFIIGLGFYMRTKVGIIIIILLLVVMSFAGCYTERDVTNYDDSGYEEYYYELSLSTNTEVFVLWPVPVINSTLVETDKEILSKLVNEIELITGNGNYKIEETKYSYVLNITFSNSIEIKAKKKINDEDLYEQTDYFFDNLSMRNVNEKNQYYVYSSKDNVTLNKFSCYLWFDRSSGTDYFIYVDIENIELEKGWQSITFW